VKGRALSGRVVVVSPHLDDAVLSLGATISQAARSGAAVEVLTVFAGEPASQAPASPWARRAGFRTEGEEVRARRGEDAAACALLGARQRWLAFGDAPYDRRGGEEEIFSAVAEACAGADVVVIPGFPLEHEDHAWLSPLLLGNGLPGRRLGLYAEQPYAYRSGRPPAVPDCLRPFVSQGATWTRLPACPVDWVRKWRGVRCYRSQLPLLGLTRRAGASLHRMLVDEITGGGEAVAWLAAPER